MAEDAMDRTSGGSEGSDRTEGASSDRSVSSEREDGRSTGIRRAPGATTASKGTSELNPSSRSLPVAPETSAATARYGECAGTDTDNEECGRVSLVGAGPGHPDLLTRRAWKRLTEADVVLYDSLTSDAVLDELPSEVDVIDVGKRPPNRTSQAEIDELLSERARHGERVVRLKCGDPGVFGRGGEEAEHLAAEGIAFEIVPGVSSVLAASGTSAIPLTHREHASSVTVVTGHETPEKEGSALNWSALADTITAGGTLVILMGVARLAENVRALREYGVGAETPVATVQKATWHDQRTVVADLETIVERNRAAEIESPAITIVGDVVSVRDAIETHLLR